MTQLILAGAPAAAASSLGAGAARIAAGTAAAYAANVADRLIFGPRKRSVEGPRLEALQLQASTEGAAVLRAFGRARVAGQIIWAANFKETVSETTERSGKGGRLSATQTTTTEYLYSLSFAVGLCEGPIDRIGRVWADGRPLDLSPYNVRLYRGTEDQLPDALIEAVEGAAPAFRGLAFLVFEDLPLAEFGNRIPQLSVEIEKSLKDADPAALENALRAVTMIPGSGEFAYGTTRVLRETGEGAVVPENANNNGGGTNFAVSLDALLAAAPNMEAVSLIVSWFGTDLRAGQCQVKPGVEVAQKATAPYLWRAGGVLRAGAHVVSRLDGAPAYGGTPADRSVNEAIQAMKAKGLAVTLHPFVLMDVPPGNGLPDPYGGAEQAAYPWRGRITVGANDKTAAAAIDVASFFGAAAPSDFSAVNGEIVYAGPAEWSFRRMILHMAHLAALAGGVEGFLLGSELRGITGARSGAGVFPAVAALKALAADVKAILPDAKISYGADWSEYFGHQPADGSGDVFFHLDPLWSDPNIAYVGIDNYLPLSDWRDGFSHLDAQAGYSSIYDRGYLRANVEGGERFDWYYASEADRAAQLRTPIVDGAYGEDWVFRVKDIRAWWSNPHHDRPGGVRAETPTQWVPQSKPVIFTELGCPAIDKGANQPNVFVDPKSAESAFPHFSSGARDDLAQRRALEAVIGYWGDPGNNPLSDVYGGPMIDTGRSFVYAWDARPFPFFPALSEIWGDAPNWEKGHWLNGRLGRAPLSLLVKALAAESGVTQVDTDRLRGTLAGYVLDRPLSARAAIDPLAEIFQFDMAEAASTLRFQMRDAPPVLFLTGADLAERAGGALSVETAQADDLPRAFRLGFLDETADYLPALAEARDPAADNAGETGMEAPLVIDGAMAGARARALLAGARAMRETAEFRLPPSRLAVEPGDSLHLDTDGVARRWRVTEILDAGDRRASAARSAPEVYDSPAGALSFRPPSPAPVWGAPVFALLDLPAFDEEDADGAAFFAAFADPWPGAVALYRETGAGPVLSATARGRAVMGRLDAPAPAFTGAGRWLDQALRVRLAFGAFEARSEEEILAGANILAVETPRGWEAIQFRDAVLGEDGVWTLSRLLRGQAGTEDCAKAGAAAGARAALIGPALARAAFPLSLRGEMLSWRAGPAGDLPETESFALAEAAPGARSLTPLAPVHLKAVREAGGLRLSWVRRTRLGGDDWRGEAPLAEAFERYTVRILDGETVLRTVEAPSPTYHYTDEDAEADFGPGGAASAAAPAFEAAQISDRVGEGAAARKPLR